MTGHYATITADQLRQFIERIERLEEDKKGIADDIKEVFAEAKANGFNAKAMREIIKIRKKSANELEEEEYLIGMYKIALGMADDENI